MNPETSSAPLTVFCGKGGVGKTTLGLSYGLWHARRGHKVVVVTSHPLDELALSVSLNGLSSWSGKAAANLFVVHIEPAEILAAKVKQQIPSSFLVNAVLSSHIYQSLVEVAPGIKEIAFLSRLRQLADRQTEGGEKGSFDLLIWDAPASGHFLQTLKVASSFHSYLSGPFAAIGKEVMQFFSDPSKISLFPITTLEDMAVEETIELCNKLEVECSMRPSMVLCNMVSPLLSSSDSELKDLRDKLQQSGERLADMNYILDRHAIERELYQKMRSTVRSDFCLVERVPNWSSDLELVVGLSEQIGRRLPCPV